MGDASFDVKLFPLPINRSIDDPRAPVLVLYPAPPTGSECLYLTSTPNPTPAPTPVVLYYDPKFNSDAVISEVFSVYFFLSLKIILYPPSPKFAFDSLVSFAGVF